MSKESKDHSLLAIIIIFIFWFFKAFFKPSESNNFIIAEVKPSKKIYFVIGIIILGLSAQVGSFFIDKSDKSPELSKFFTPEYVNAKEGIKILSGKGRLSTEDKGFSELKEIAQEVLLDNIKKSPNTGGYLPPILITSMTQEVAANISGELLGGSIGIHVYNLTRPDEPFTISLEKVQTEIENRKNIRLFRLSGLIFVVGFVLQIISLIVNNQFSASKIIIPEEILHKRLSKLIGEKEHLQSSDE